MFILMVRWFVLTIRHLEFHGVVRHDITVKDTGVVILGKHVALLRGLANSSSEGTGYQAEGLKRVLEEKGC